MTTKEVDQCQESTSNLNPDENNLKVINKKIIEENERLIMENAHLRSCLEELTNLKENISSITKSAVIKLVAITDSFINLQHDVSSAKEKFDSSLHATPSLVNGQTVISKEGLSRNVQPNKNGPTTLESIEEVQEPPEFENDNEDKENLTVDDNQCLDLDKITQRPKVRGRPKKSDFPRDSAQTQQQSLKQISTTNVERNKVGKKKVSRKAKGVNEKTDKCESKKPRL